jgi:para-aminobenzoate synthetase component 1
MPRILVESLPYCRDSAEVFAGLAAEPWSMLLDSGTGGAGGGRFDILVARPRMTLITRGPVTELRSAAGVRHSGGDPLDLLREALGPMREPHPELPFVGGALGWYGYDLARRFEQIALSSALPARLPQMAVGLYDWALVTDHVEQTTRLVGWDVSAAAAERHPACLRLRAAALLAVSCGSGSRSASRSACEPGPFAIVGALRSNLDRAAYRDRFERVQRYIHAGDCYQVNLARRFSAPARGDPWRAYLHLRAINPAPFAGYLNTPGAVVMSASPERFLAVRDGAVATHPIKGTTRRDRDPARDRALAAALRTSAKDRAENVMIVDLLRNDLGRCCAVGSVQVPRLFDVESFAGVHHLISTVQGRLRPDADALTLLRCCFPGGSITGAPKHRTMQIIDELEGEARGVYCGSIGYLGFDGAMDSNIAIRTLTLEPAPGAEGCADARLSFSAGGGLVADSRCGAEWDEIGIKARAMLELVRHFGGSGAGTTRGSIGG